MTEQETEEHRFVVETARRMANHAGALISLVEELASEREQLHLCCERLERERGELREAETVACREREEAAEALAELRCAYEALLQEYEASQRALHEAGARHEALLRERTHAAERLEAILNRLAV